MTAFAVRSTFHRTLQNTPGQLVVGCDMILNVKHRANWEYIQKWKQNLIEKNSKAENAKRIPHTYEIGETRERKKYQTPCQGPYTIMQFNENWYSQNED